MLYVVLVLCMLPGLVVARAVPGVRWHWGSKDGGPESHVWAYGLEVKWLCSVLVMRFEDGSRDAYHDHAFDAVSWVVNREGRLQEYLYGSERPDPECDYTRTAVPIVTPSSRLHRVVSVGRTWVLTFRGPWARTWREVTPEGARVLTHGRKQVNAG